MKNIVIICCFILSSFSFANDINKIATPNDIKAALSEIIIQIENIKARLDKLENQKKDVPKTINIEKNSEKHIVNTWKLNLREANNSNARIVKVFDIGAIVTVVDKTENGWSKLDSGLFVYSKNLISISELQQLDATVITEQLNIRSMPVLKDEFIIDKLDFGENLRVFSKPFYTYWYKLVDEKGFVHKSSVLLKDVL